MKLRKRYAVRIDGKTERTYARFGNARKFFESIAIGTLVEIIDMQTGRVIVRG